MKKTMKSAPLFTPYYTPGRNIFGEIAETHFIVLKKETAFEQMLDAVRQLDGSVKEFTFDHSCFNDNPAAYEEICQKIGVILSIKMETRSWCA